MCGLARLFAFPPQTPGRDPHVSEHTLAPSTRSVNRLLQGMLLPDPTRKLSAALTGFLACCEEIFHARCCQSACENRQLGLHGVTGTSCGEGLVASCWKMYRRQDLVEGLRSSSGPHDRGYARPNGPMLNTQISAKMGPYWLWGAEQ